jgi:metallo-beta-lactamase family protein
VRISGRDVAVRARIRRIDSYSAHADRDELIAWAKARQPVAGGPFLTHGEPGALAALREGTAGLASDVLIPEIGETYSLPAAAPPKRLRTGRGDLRQVLQRDWQNDYADLATQLKQRLQRIEGERNRREAIARIRDVLDRYGSAHTRGAKIRA